jgi:spore coat polysaccharide biosynthesis protein SpsF
MPKVLIGIQARSGSTRLPKKAFEMIGHSRMLDHVIDSCKKASQYIDSIVRFGVVSEVVVVTPVGDPIVNSFSSRCRIIEGSEADVLSRYAGAVHVFDPDYIVRITGDCP